MRDLRPAVLTVFLLLLTAAWTPGALFADTSSLWGTNGEVWDPSGRLGDYSFAGYRTGSEPIPDRTDQLNVKDFGAEGDGIADDTSAFHEAILLAQPGQAVYAPAGTYRILDVIEIRKRGISLRGDGPGQTILNFERHLTELRGPGLTDAGLPFDENGCDTVEPPPVGDFIEWSFVGGLIWVEGQDPVNNLTLLADVTQPASRGDQVLVLSDVGSLVEGMWIRLTQTDPARTDPSTGSFVRHLHGDITNGGCEQTGRTLLHFQTRIAEINGNSITMERPLPVDVSVEWRPEVHRFRSSVQDVGIS